MVTALQFAIPVVKSDTNANSLRLSRIYKWIMILLV